MIPCSRITAWFTALEFERELADVCRTYDLGVIPYSPLAGGFLTGKYRQGQEAVQSERARGAQRHFQ